MNRRGRKPTYKTFYLSGGSLGYAFIAAMQDYAGHEYLFEHQGDGFYETNIPLTELQAIARMVGCRMPEYTSSKTKQG